MISAAVTRLCDVTPQPVDWLWESRVPLGMLTIFDGDPGLGKSTVLLDLAARLSRGDAMPDGSAGPPVSGTVILTAEDDLARVVRPRLDAAGADTRRIASVSVVDGDVEREPEITAEDLTAVEDAVQLVGARLVVVDPLMAYLPSEVNSNRDQDVRRALVHLKALAERTGVAVVVVRHLNKAQGGPALYRGGGSIGIIGAARSGLLLAADPDAADTGRVLAVVKSNLAAKPPSLRLQLVQAPGVAFASVLWGESCNLSAAELLGAPAGPEKRGALAEAEDFLGDVLVEGPLPAAEVERQAAEFGITPVTLRRARRELGVVSKKLGRPGQSEQQWQWSLPSGNAEGDHGLDAKEVNTRADDLLRVRKPVSDCESLGSPKGVNGDQVDPLRGDDLVAPSTLDIEAGTIDLSIYPLRIDRGIERPCEAADPRELPVVDGPDESVVCNEEGAPASGAKEVISIDHDPLRVTVVDEPSYMSAHSEGGQADGDEHLRVAPPEPGPRTRHAPRAAVR